MPPASLTKEQLADTLRSIAQSVEAGDSYDGSLEYHIQMGGQFDVVAMWRFGNTEGQGGCRTLGAPEEATVSGPDIVQKLTNALSWALSQINHVDISTPEYRDGVHAHAEPHCPICAKYQAAKRVLLAAEPHCQSSATRA